ncbi:hypothetical protein ACJX0J_001708 (mitochondrion) [Zea mays]
MREILARIVKWHWEQSIVSKRWKCRAMGSICLIFGLVSRNYFYTSPCSVLARLLAAVAELGASRAEGLFPWVKEGAALTYGLVYLPDSIASRFVNKSTVERIVISGFRFRRYRLAADLLTKKSKLQRKEIAEEEELCVSVSRAGMQVTPEWTGTISWAQVAAQIGAHFFALNGDHQTKEGIMLHIGTTHFWVELPYGNQAPYNVTLPTIRVRTTGTLDSLPLFASPMIRYDTPR